MTGKIQAPLQNLSYEPKGGHFGCEDETGPCSTEGTLENSFFEGVALILYLNFSSNRQGRQLKNWGRYFRVKSASSDTVPLGCKCFGHGRGYWPGPSAPLDATSHVKSVGVTPLFLYRGVILMAIMHYLEGENR